MHLQSAALTRRSTMLAYSMPRAWTARGTPSHTTMSRLMEVLRKKVRSSAPHLRC